jgi:hypothetical protein
VNTRGDTFILAPGTGLWVAITRTCDFFLYLFHLNFVDFMRCCGNVMAHMVLENTNTDIVISNSTRNMCAVFCVTP